MDPTPIPPDDGHEFPSDAVLRRPFPRPRPLRRDLQHAHARASEQLSGIDGELEAVLARRRACLRELDGLRARLNHRWTEHHVRRHARVDEAPVPPAPPDAEPLHGGDLREVCLTVLRRHGPQELRALHGLLHCYGYIVGGVRPVQRLGDAMAYELRCGRVERIARGEYAATGAGPRRVRRYEPIDPPAEPLPWAPPVTDPAPPLLDPPVVNDPEHWSGGAWPTDPDADADLDVSADVDADAEPTGTPPSPTVGDDSSTNRPRGTQAEASEAVGDGSEGRAAGPDPRRRKRRGGSAKRRTRSRKRRRRR